MKSLPFAIPFALATGFLFVINIPAFAQVDISGEWAGRTHEDQPHRNDGPTIGEWPGIPLNDAARFNAESWDSSILSLSEHQAWQYSSTLAFYAPGNARITKQVDDRSQQTVACKLDFSIFQMPRTVWMDGRSHPPAYAPHTWVGFSTEFADKTGIPFEAAQGGRATMYPEYAAKLRRVAAPDTSSASR